MTRSTTSGGLPLASDLYEAPPIHIPDLDGGAFKTELTLYRSAERTEKLIWWHGPDPRPVPHDHPWPFTSTIIRGGYTEHRYTIGDGGGVRHEVRTYRSTPPAGHIAAPNDGNTNHVPLGVYHTVTDVLPGTVTHLVCGAARSGNEWGSLDTDTGEPIAFDDARVADPTFIERLHRLNPHLQPESWAAVTARDISNAIIAGCSCTYRANRARQVIRYPNPHCPLDARNTEFGENRHTVDPDGTGLHNVLDLLSPDDYSAAHDTNPDGYQAKSDRLDDAAREVTALLGAAWTPQSRVDLDPGRACEFWCDWVDNHGRTVALFLTNDGWRSQAHVDGIGLPTNAEFPDATDAAAAALARLDNRA